MFHPLESVMRSKRRCVLEKKQPYSGDEWCSGPDTEEDEEKPHTVMHRESIYLLRELSLSVCSPVITNKSVPSTTTLNAA